MYQIRMSLQWFQVLYDYFIVTNIYTVHGKILAGEIWRITSHLPKFSLPIYGEHIWHMH